MAFDILTAPLFIIIQSFSLSILLGSATHYTFSTQQSVLCPQYIFFFTHSQLHKQLKPNTKLQSTNLQLLSHQFIVCIHNTTLDSNLCNQTFLPKPENSRSQTLKVSISPYIRISTKLILVKGTKIKQNSIAAKHYPRQSDMEEI